MSPLVKVLPPEPNIKEVKPDVADKIYQLLKNGRRYFGSSGASLTQQIYNPVFADKGIKPELAKIGLEGERDTTSILKKWIKDKPNAVLIDSVHLRGYGEETVDEETGMIEGGDTDHIVIIGSEVILIDTKRWKSKRNYTVGDDGQALRSGQSFPGGNVQMQQAVFMWYNYFNEEASVIGIVHINAEETVVFRNRNWYTKSYRLVELNRFLELLDEKYKIIADEDKETINTTLVAKTVVGCVKPFDLYERVFDMENLRNFK